MPRFRFVFFFFLMIHLHEASVQQELNGNSTFVKLFLSDIAEH